jgi:hypothetical protein
MQRYLSWTALVVMLFWLLPGAPADDTTDKPDAKAKAKDKLLKSGKPFQGKLAAMDEKEQSLTVEVTSKSTTPDPQVTQNITNLQQQAEALRIRNVADRARRLNDIKAEIDKNQKNLYKDITQKLELQAADDMKVRTNFLPNELDEKGKPRRLTDKEKKALKGPDPSLPGYTADFDSLKKDQTVEVHLAKAKDSAKSKTKDKDAAGGDKEKPKVAMIVIVKEPPK